MRFTLNNESTTGRAVRWLACLWICLVSVAVNAATPLATLEFKIVGTELRVSPPMLAVPKGIPGSVLVQLSDAGSSAASATTPTNVIVEATLRGPGLDARRLVSRINAPLLLPALNLVGDYQLDGIRLLDATTGEVKFEGNPSSVPVHVFDEVLVSKVTSRPLTGAEITDRGIEIDQNNFKAVEFEVGFVLDGKTIPVKFPVVSPRFDGNTEIVPAAELEKRLQEATLLNQQIGAATTLPPELEQSQLNIQLSGINFQRVDVGEDDLGLAIPPIPALMVIPGNIGFLNQFFSVQIFTENGAPQNSGLSVFNVRAKLVLPPGPDLVASTNYAQPGDDPLRFARVGPDKIIQPIQPVVRAGIDGVVGTADDIGRILPGETGQAEFLVEGLQEGLHVMDLDLTADLDGLAAGTVQIKGKAAGSVLVRNAKFSIAFSHPGTVRFGEPYEASVTVLNTGLAPANFVQVSLASRSISGGLLESDETVQLGTILPGQTATARYRIRAQRTGAISFSNLTTGDDSVQGRFRLTMGIDERGVALSPDTILMPDFVNQLPTNLLYAAQRVLGQALSSATAAQLPAGVIKTPKSVVTRRVLDLAEAGQRVKCGDEPRRVLVDLMLDWQGGRSFQNGFDQILRETDAGFEWREAVAAAVEATDLIDAAARLTEIGPDLAGRSEPWLLAAAGVSQLAVSSELGNTRADAEASDIVGAMVYPGERGAWLAALNPAGQRVRWRSTNALGATPLTALLLGTNGTGQRFEWSLPSLAADSCVFFAADDAGGSLKVDAGCDGFPDGTLAATSRSISELPPGIITVIQDTKVLAGRPAKPCLRPEDFNYGTVVAVLFSKPMTQASVDRPSAYVLDNGNVAGSVQIQSGGRVALLNMRQTLSAIRPRTITVSGIEDPRGNAIIAAARPVQTDERRGVAVRGRVVRADGSPAANVPVTLTMYDKVVGLDDCPDFTQKPLQVFTDDHGMFSIDYVMSGIPYSISATDTGGLTPQAIALILGSIEGDRVARDKLLEIANDPATQDTLLAAFAAGAVPELIVKAEGLDRAIFRDSVNSAAREGVEIVVALRFRGRGTVVGRVLGPDGVTPIPSAAVNLVPDPDSRELVRGQLSGSDGTFRFNGVPLGVFSISATNNFGNYRVASGALAEPGETNRIDLVLTTNVQVFATLAGRVFEEDGLTPHPGARVFVGDVAKTRVNNIVASTIADGDGFWMIPAVPAGRHGVAAISIDGSRRATREGVDVVPGADTQVVLSLNGTATVVGRVETSTGAPVANAAVAGGSTVVRTDANGLFSLPGVPVGNQTISAGIERDPSVGRDFPRIGSTSLDVLGGIENFAVIRFTPAGRIIGRVLNQNGVPVPKVNVAIPQMGGFLWVTADAAGNYAFEGLGLAAYELSAPAPPVAKTDTSGLLDQIANGSEDEVFAAIQDAFAIFTGASDPFLNGEGDAFSPDDWGFNKTALKFDGQTVVVDVRFLRKGSVSGTVINGQGVPIGAKVRLTGLAPKENGSPALRVRGDVNSDPALGTFRFDNLLFTGPWGLQAASPFFPVVISQSGVTTSTELDVTNVVLQFPQTREIAGRLVGHIFNPDGAPAGSNVNVQISFSADYIIRTDGEGFFDTQIGLPAQPKGTIYSVTATNLDSGLVGRSQVTVLPGITNEVDVVLLDTGSMEVGVRFANGVPATNATVVVRRSGFPEQELFAPTDTNGVARFFNLFEGDFSVAASAVSGPVTLMGRSAVIVVAATNVAVSVTLEPTATIRGTFTRRDLVTPVESAQIRIGSLAFATTDANGGFEVQGLPLGTYKISGQNPVTGVGGSLTATLVQDGEVKTVRLVEQSMGEIRGLVIGAYGTNVVPSAAVTLEFADSGFPKRTVTSGPDGSFSFPAVPAGGFTINAKDPVTKLEGARSGNLGENVPLLVADITLEARGAFLVQVLRPGGVLPAANAQVSVSFQGRPVREASADTNGIVRILDLPLGTYGFLARASAPFESRNVGQTNASVTLPGAEVPVAVVLNGLGGINGQVVRSDGTTPAGFIEVKLTVTGGVDNRATEVAVTDEAGRFAFDNVPVTSYELRATSQALGARVNDAILASGQTNSHLMTLSQNGAVIGRLVRADGVTPVAGAEFLLQFMSGSGLPGRAFERTAADGSFEFRDIPLGNFTYESAVFAIAGILRGGSTLVGDGATNDLGVLRFDEDDPFVVAMQPPPGSAGVPVNTTVDLFFNEAIDAASVSNKGVYLRLGTNDIPATVQVLPNPTNGVNSLVRLTPRAPLKSLMTYQMTVIDGERVSAVGNVIGRGPVDLVGRQMTAPFQAAFTTVDADPPVLLSTFPTNGEPQVDPRAIPRLSFNEPVRSTNFTITLTGPSGPVTGTATVLLNGLAIAFTPNVALQPNASYTLTADGIRDIAGNALTNQPRAVTFATLDTVGPTIAMLRVADGRSAVAGTTVPVEALLAVSEPGVSVRFTRDLIAAGSANGEPFRANILVPSVGSTTIRAIATDRFNNDGPLAELVLSAASNQPPVVVLTRVGLASAMVGSGEIVTLNVSATDDSAVTNLAMVGVGGISVATNFANGASRTLSFTVPAGATPGTQLFFHAQATDDLGVKSVEAVVTLEVADRSAPTLAIFDPLNGVQLPSGPAFTLAVLSSDNSTNARMVTVVAGPPLSATQSVVVASAVNIGVTNRFTLSLSNAPAAGGSVLVTVTATDSATNTSTVSATYRLPDVAPPQLLSLSPTNGQTGVAVRPLVSATFDEPIATNSVSTNSFLVLTEAGPVVGVFSFANSNRVVRWTPDAPLRFLTNYSVVLLDTLTDESGNALAAATNRFTVTDFALTEPTNGLAVVEGQRVRLRAAGTSTSGIAGVEIRSGDALLTTLAGSAFTNSMLVPALVQPGTNEVVFTATVSFIGLTNRVELAPLTLIVHPAGADSDGDGLTNGAELAAGTDPFTSDAGVDSDGDGLSNAQEIALGTNPNNPDTDGDGIRDDVDPNPLVANQRPVAVASLVTNLDGTITIAFGGTDPDGDPLTVRVTSLPPIGRTFTTTNGVDPDAILLSVPVVVTSVPPRVIYRSLAVDATNHLRFVVNDGFINSVEATVTLVSTNDPTVNRDGDGMPDSYELAFGLDPFTNDADLDLDGDTLTNFDEFMRGTRPDRRDTDMDGLNDGAEVALGTNPLNPDTDGDGIIDGFDPDPFAPNADFDGDGIADVDDPDIDGDGLSNTDELTRGTDARNPDSDGDGWRDGPEVEAGSDPMLASSVPAWFHVASPDLTMILPTLPVGTDLTDGVVVARPEASVILLTLTDAGGAGGDPIYVARPEASLILLALGGSDQGDDPLFVASPVASLILPALSADGEITNGVVVARPEALLVLPVNPVLDPADLGVFVAGPVIMLKIEGAAGGAPVGSSLGGGGGGSENGGTNDPVRSVSALRIVELQQVAVAAAAAIPGQTSAATPKPTWKAVLEWPRPDSGTHVVECSADLTAWTPVAVETLPAPTGMVRVRCDVVVPSVMFYRLRHTP